ncbi:MAG: hypothetical protein AAF081_08305 [Actinomycetota bacterium]
MVRTAVFGLGLLMAASACGDHETSVETLTAPPPVGELSPLEAILESWNTTIVELPGWESGEPWHVEGAESAWATGCADFDRLGDLVLRDLPLVTVWERPGAAFSQRVASLDWDAAGYRDLVVAMPTSCPTIEVDGTTIEITGFRSGVLDPPPRSSWAAIELSAHPLADPATEGRTPTFDTERRAVLVVLVRHNVVSQLIIGLDDGTDIGIVAEVVAAADAALQAAPIETTGPFPPPTSSPTVPAQRLDAVELTLDREMCRNGGSFTVDGITFALAEAVPNEWRAIDPLVGVVVIDGAEATFTGPDGHDVRLSSSGVEASCSLWVERSNPPDPGLAGLLDCGVGQVTEIRFPDAGYDPDAIVADAHPDVVTVEAGDPLQWRGIDAAGQVVAEVFLGDAVPADWQIFICAAG